MAADKVGRPAGSKNRQKDKTLEDFGMSRDLELDLERKLEGLMKKFKEEIVVEMKEHIERMMEHNDKRMETMEKMLKNIKMEMQKEKATREEKWNR